MHGLCTQNYPPNIFPSKSIQGEEGDEEEEVAQEYSGTKDEYEAMFQPYLTLKGLVIWSPTKQQGGSSHSKYVSIKGKTRMSPQQMHPSDDSEEDWAF